MGEYKPGDLIGFSGYSPVSGAINLLSYGVPFWSLSHVAILGEHNGKLLLFESDDASVPCAVHGRPFAGTQAREIDSKIESYNGRVWHYPLYRELYEDEQARLNEFLVAKLGLPYDCIGAIRAGGFGWSLMESWLRPACLESIFCSEYCCAAYAHIGIFPTSHVSRWSPNRFVRTARRMGLLMRPRRIK